MDEKAKGWNENVPKRCLGPQRDAYARLCPKEVLLKIGALLLLLAPLPHYRSGVPVQLHKKCAVLKEFVQFNGKARAIQFNSIYVVTQGCKKVTSNKNGRFRYELIGETQPEMKLLERVACIYPFLQKAGSSIPYATKRTQHYCILCAVLYFSSKNSDEKDNLLKISQGPP